MSGWIITGAAAWCALRFDFASTCAAVAPDLPTIVAAAIIDILAT